METIVFLTLFIFIFIPLVIYIRFLDLGVKPLRAVQLLIRFPKDIYYLHMGFYNDYKKDNRKLAFKLLFLPFYDLPKVIISYVEMHMEIEAKFRAIVELLEELNGEKLNILIKVLSKEGISIKKRRRVERKLDRKTYASKYTAISNFVPEPY